MELADFLKARLDDLKAALLQYRDGHDGPCVNFEGQDPAHYSEYDSCALHLKAAEASPYRDVAFGLAEVEAKRQIIRWHYRRPGPKWDTPEAKGFECATCDQQFPCTTLRLLALPYANHEAYQPEWKP
ncbi:DUF6221 family protein [Streptomyces sp. NPDC019443]|uniref:DUF6221 family protein n=1 Tax=Streptomyces sp. NPDC019443 TaxID=3365061 RepID=UPI003790AF92